MQLTTTDASHLASQHRRSDIPALTGLRFVAAMAVLCGHMLGTVVYFGNAAPYQQVAPCFAGLGMELFFVLSGFVIHYTYFDIVTGAGTRPLRTFFSARFSRLYPLFLTVLTIDLVINRRPTVPLTESAWTLPLFLSMTQTWFFGINRHVPLDYQFGPAVSVSWSISAEWFFYLAYPLFARVLLTRLLSAKMILGCAFIGSVAAWICIESFRQQINNFGMTLFGPEAGTAAQHPSYTFSYWLYYYSPFLRLFDFMVGVGIAHLVLVRPALPKLPETGDRNVLAYMALAAVLAGAALFWTKIVPETGFTVVYVPAAVLCLLCSVRGDNWLARLMARPVMVRGGEISYSIYLLHPFVLPFFYTAGYGLTMRGIAAATLTSFAAISLVLVASAVTYRYLEVPAKKDLRRWLEPDAVGHGKQLGRVLVLIYTSALIASPFALLWRM